MKIKKNIKNVFLLKKLKMFLQYFKPGFATVGSMWFGRPRKIAAAEQRAGRTDDTPNALRHSSSPWEPDTPNRRTLGMDYSVNGRLGQESQRLCGL